MAEPRRGPVLTFFAVIFVLLAIQILLKPLRLEGPNTGFVFFGTRLQGSSALVGVPFALFLLAYASAIWRMRRHALPMAYVYAVRALEPVTVRHQSAATADAGGIDVRNRVQHSRDRGLVVGGGVADEAEEPVGLNGRRARVDAAAVLSWQDSTRGRFALDGRAPARVR